MFSEQWTETQRRDLSLAKRAAGGDVPAFEVLISEIRPRLCDHIARYIPASMRRLIDGDDMIQEACVIATRRIRDFVPETPNSFYRWMAAIALSCLRDSLKRYRAAKRGGKAHAVGRIRGGIEESSIQVWNLLVGSDQTPSRVVRGHEASRAVLDAVGKLPEHYRQAVWMIHIEQRSVADAASRMGKSERAVHGLCRRGLKLLQEQLVSMSRFISTMR